MSASESQTGGKVLANQYVPSEHEGVVRARWEASGAFHADPGRVLRGEAEPYCVVIPPPNVTDRLHLGHALNNTLQDVLVRAHRMQGYETLWMAGTDHAGIATQAVVERRLMKEHNKRRIDYSRKEFVGLVQAWKDEYEQVITNQLKMMGCSCDWQRQRFTMDDQCARAVYEAFFRLFSDGLIYRGKRLVNWDPVLQTAVADDECFDEEIDGTFSYLRYPLVHADRRDVAIATGGSGLVDPMPVTWGELARRGYPGATDHDSDQQAFVTVATTRPETYLGDTAVAINPHDTRAAALRGLFVELPLVGRVIPIVEDSYVVLPRAMAEALGREEEAKDPKAGMATGFLKVTPAHDFNDYEIGQRHNLAKINILSPDGRISDKHGWSDVADARHLVGLKREEARKKVTKEFESRGLLEGVKPYRHSVPHSDRSKAIIEPYLSDQWYVKVTDPRLAAAANEVLGEEEAAPYSVGRASSPAVPTPSSALDPSKHSWEQGVGKAPRTYIRRLPHVEKAGSTYFVTFRVKVGQLEPAERKIVLDACTHWNGTKMWVYAVSVMPDHVHLLLRPLIRDDGAARSLGEIMHSIKSYSAHAIQAARGVSGPLWQDEWFDRIVRDDSEFEEKLAYIQENAVRAGLAMKPGTYPYQKVDLSHRSAQVDATAGEDARPTASGSRESNHAEKRGQRLTFHPPRYATTYRLWHENIRDWCISRQLWWGHQVPVWSGPVTQLKGIKEQLAAKGAAVQVSGERVFVCLREPGDAAGVAMLESAGLVRDEDVLDTWFSSALWPLSTMGWPEQTQLLEAFNPTTTLCTAREIITLWVSRMVMFNRYLAGTGQGQGPSPFDNVVIHPIVQDGEGRKMSKSLGNGIDPLDIIASHGSDAMRFTLAHMTTQTQDVRLPVAKDHTGRNSSPKFDLGKRLCSKLWSATVGLALRRLPKKVPGTAVKRPMVKVSELALVDRWMLSRLAEATRHVDRAIANFEYSEYATAIYDLIWRDLCDWYLEAIKPTIEQDARQQAVLAASLQVILRLSHPLMPYVTEVLFEALQQVDAAAIEGVETSGPDRGEMLCTAAWPVLDAGLIDEASTQKFEQLREVVGVIRESRAAHNVSPKRKINLHVPAELATMLQGELAWISQITVAGLNEVTSTPPIGAHVAIRLLGHDAQLSDLAEAIDAGAEAERKAKRIAELQKQKGVIEGRLNSPGYMQRAPAKLVDESKQQLKQIEDELAGLVSHG